MSRLLDGIEKKRAALLSVKEGAEQARKHAKEVSTERALQGVLPRELYKGQYRESFTRGIAKRA